MSDSDEKVFHVTVLVTTEYTYRVTSSMMPEVTDEASAVEFIKTADIETVDDCEIHSETVSTEVVGAEPVDG